MSSPSLVAGPQSGAPAAPPAPGSQPGQAPPGSSPASGPVANRGTQAAGIAKLGLVVKLLEGLVPDFGVATEEGRDVIKALNTLSKHVPPGAVSPGVEKMALEDLLRKMQQRGPQVAAMRQANPIGGPPAAPPTQQAA